MTNDLVSDMLTRIRNSSMARHTYVRVRYSKLNLAILKVLETESYIDSYVIEEENNPKQDVWVGHTYYLNILVSLRIIILEQKRFGERSKNVTPV